MEFVQQLNHIATESPTVLLLVLSGMVIFLFLMQITNMLRTRSLVKRFKALINGENTNLEELLLSQIDQLEALSKNYEELMAKHDRLVKKEEQTVGNVGIVRFSAFADTGSDQSFAIALLDDFDNGVVISSLHGREEARTYAKPIEKGQSRYLLTAEEKQAIDEARKKKIRI